MPFHDREDAGRKLATQLAHYRNQDPVVLALPRGGVPVAAEIAVALSADLDVVLVRKIGVPTQPELAMGAVVDGGQPTVVRNEDVIQIAGVTEEEFQNVCNQGLTEIEERRQQFLHNRARANVYGKTAIVVDDGIATGATMRAALRATRSRQPATLVLAVPVAPTDTLAQLRAEADNTFCLETYDLFGSVGFYYSDFRQIDNQEVTETLARFPPKSVSTTAMDA